MIDSDDLGSRTGLFIQSYLVGGVVTTACPTCILAYLAFCSLASGWVVALGILTTAWKPLGTPTIAWKLLGIPIIAGSF